MTGSFSTEEIRVKGEELLATVKEIVHQGNVRRLIIRDGEGVTLIEVPLTIGVVGVVLLPVWAAIGAIAALATDCTIVVERRINGEGDGDADGGGKDDAAPTD